MRRFVAFVIIFALGSSLANAATSPAGTNCKKIGLVKTQNNKIYTCIKVGKNLKFNAGVVISKAPAKTTEVTPTPTPTPTPAPTPTFTNLTDPIALPNSIVIAPDCSLSKSCPTPTPVRINQADTCHAKVEAVLQKQVEDKWVDFAPAQGWEFISTCPSTNPYHPWTIATIETGTVIRWKVYSPGAWEWFSTPYSYKPRKPIPQDVLDKQRALEALANEPATTFTPTSSCQMLDAATPNRSFGTDLSAGFPRVRIRLPNSGHVKALILPIDFSDQPGVDDAFKFFAPLAKDVRDFYAAQSYGKVSFDFEIAPNWIRAPFLSTKYGMGGNVGRGDPTGYRNELIGLLDGTIDFSKYDEVYFLVPKEMPMAIMGWGPAYTTPTYTSTGYSTNGATGGADMYYNIPYVRGAMWKWMAHETGHTFGLYDEDYLHQSSSLGNWSIMAMNWSNEGIELGAWDRYLLGWLPDSQIKCLPKQMLKSETVKLSPIVRQDSFLKSMMIPLSSTKILVVESRKAEGFDTLKQDHAGVLVYTVDFTKPQLGGGYVIVPRVGTEMRGDFTDAALHAGDTVLVDGVTIKVDAISNDGDTVSVSLN